MASDPDGAVASLSALLTVSGLLLAALAAIVVVHTGGPRGVPAPPFEAEKAAKIVLWVQVVMALGALSAWLQLYVGGGVRPLVEWPPAAALLLGVAVQPFLAWYLVLGMRTKE